MADRVIGGHVDLLGAASLSCCGTAVEIFRAVVPAGSRIDD
jgi:hypothetical protein